MLIQKLVFDNNRFSQLFQKNLVLSSGVHSILLLGGGGGLKKFSNKKCLFYTYLILNNQTRHTINVTKQINIVFSNNFSFDV